MQHEEQDREHHAERELGAEHAAPHAGQAESLEPEVVGVEAGDAAGRDEQNEEDGENDEQTGPTTRRSEPAALRQIRGGSHGQKPR